jgi:hypothetical protein
MKLAGADLARWIALSGVEHVLSDQAIQAVFTGVSWQRCRVHFKRNLLSHVPKTAQSMVAAISADDLPPADPGEGPQSPP